MLDLDRFKQVNDRYGHQMGDAVLIELASRMRTEVREVDTLARYGGEEFVVVLPETDATGAARTADRLGEVIRSSPFCASSPHPLPVTASIGVAVFPDHGANASRLLRSADNALYAAKNDGRDCWRFATLADDAGQGADDADARRSASGAGAGIAPDEAALREAFDGASPLARTEQSDRDDVVVMPDVEVAGRADPRGQRGPGSPHA
jgi:diguanylate cyclase (GGDEF)-like protein